MCYRLALLSVQCWIQCWGFDAPVCKLCLAGITFKARGDKEVICLMREQDTENICLHQLQLYKARKEAQEKLTLSDMPREDALLG